MEIFDFILIAKQKFYIIDIENKTYPLSQLYSFRKNVRTSENRIQKYHHNMSTLNHIFRFNA